MHKYRIMLADGDQDEISSDYVQFAPTHIVFMNSMKSPYDEQGKIVAAIRADTVLMVEQIEQQEGEPC